MEATGSANDARAGPASRHAVDHHLCVSGKVPATEANEELAKIVSLSTSYNASADISGALIYTGQHFAQVLEGRLAVLDTLMLRIKDVRHAEVRVLRREPLSVRRFSSWSLAYAGIASYSARFVEQYFKDEAGERREVDPLTLRELLREFAETRSRAARHRVRPIGQAKLGS